MAEVFDPYYIWLGIPPEEQPADHYRLLGIRRFESNDEVIANAADQRIRHIRSMQAGKRQGESQRLLNEIAAAAGVLLDTDKRREYDASLAGYPALAAEAQELAALPTSNVFLPAPPATTPVWMTSHVTSPPHQRSIPLIRQRLLHWFAVGSLTVGVAAVIVVAIALASRKSPQEPTGESAKNKSPDPAAPVVPMPQVSPNGSPQQPQPIPTITLPPPTGTVATSPYPVSMDVADPIWLDSFEWRSRQAFFHFRPGANSAIGDVSSISNETTFGGNGTASWLMHNPFSINYALELDAVRKSGDGPLVIDLVIENRPGRIIIDGCKESGYRSGLEMIDGKTLADREGPGVTKGQLIPQDSLAHISIVQATELVVGTIEIGGKQKRFLCWNGTAPLGQSDDWKVDPSRRHSRRGELNLTIHSTGTGWSFRNVKLTPLFIKSPTATASAQPPHSAPAPLTGNGTNTASLRGKRIEVKRLAKTDLLSAVPRIVVAGAFGPQDGLKGIVSAGNKFDRVEFQVRTPEEYMLQATFTRLSGNNGIFLGIPLAGNPTAIVIDRDTNGNNNKHRGHFSGLVMVNDLELHESGHPAAVKGPLLTNGKKATLRVIVQQNSITVDLDGRRMVQWSGDRSKLGLFNEYILNDHQCVGLGTFDNSSYHIESLELSEIDVVGASQPGVPLTFDVAQPLDILKKARVRDGSGNWQLSPGEKLTTTGAGMEWASFDLVLSGEYVLEATVTRKKGKDGLLFGITMDGHPCAVSLDCFVDEGKGPLSGLEQIDGQRMQQPGYSAVHAGPMFKNDQPAQLKFIVLRHEFILQCDNQVKLRWKGDPARLSRTKLTLSDARSNLAIGTWNSAYQIEGLKLYPIIGNGGTSLFAGNSTASSPGASPNAAPASTTPAAPVSPAATTQPEKLARLPVPDEADLAAARAKLKDAFGDMAAKSKKPEEKRKLVAELLGIADSEKDPAIRYALLDASRRLAMEASDVRAALLVAAEIARKYESEPLDQQLQTLKLASGATMPAAAWEEAVGAAMALAESGRDIGRMDVADAASLLAVDFAAKGKSLGQRKQAKQVRDGVLAYQKSAALAQEAEETLKANPDDPAANLVVGKWRCFVLEDWANGLPCLEKCGEPALAAAAMAEREPKNSLAIADAWSLIADELQGTERTSALGRAKEFYEIAAKELTGLDQLRAGKRAEEIEKGAGHERTAKTTRGVDSEPASGTRMLGREIVRAAKLTASRATRPGKFAIVEMPSAAWLRSQGSEMILTAPEKFLGTVAVLPDEYASISLLRVRGRIIEPATTNFRIWIGDTNFTLNWEQENENVVFGKEGPISKSGPHAMKPGHSHDIEIAEAAGRIRLTVDGANIFDFEGRLAGKVGFNTYDSTIAVESLEVIGKRK